MFSSLGIQVSLEEFMALIHCITRNLNLLSFPLYAGGAGYLEEG